MANKIQKLKNKQTSNKLIKADNKIKEL